jgi:hypothetical protein
MSAPERIWWNEAPLPHSYVSTLTFQGGTEYIRADLAPAAPKVSDNDEQLRIWAQEILEALSLADVLDVREYHQKIDAHCAVVDELRRIRAALEAPE